MTAFLSPEWIAAMDRAARDVAPPVDLAAPLVFEQVVREPGTAEHRWYLVVSAGGLRVVAGAASQPTLTLLTDRETAVELAAGTLNAQRALDLGRLKIRGDLDEAVAARRALELLGDVFAAVRSTAESPA